MARLSPRLALLGLQGAKVDTRPSVCNQCFRGDVTVTKNIGQRSLVWSAAALLLTAAAIGAELEVWAQKSPQIDFKSVGRGAPVMVDAATLPVLGAAYDRQTRDFI